MLALLLLITGLLALEIIGRGFAQLFRLRLRAETLTAFAWLFSLADAVALILLDYRPGLPCCAVTGQAAGTAAALTEDFSAMDIRQLQQTLKNSGVILHERELNIGKL